MKRHQTQLDEIFVVKTNGAVGDSRVEQKNRLTNAKITAVISQLLQKIKVHLYEKEKHLLDT